MAGSRYVAGADILSATVEMEGLTLLFHAASGQTHILAPPAPQILAALAGNEDAGTALAARLAELEAAGLVHRP
jgi:hypothetical protein